MMCSASNGRSRISRLWRQPAGTGISNRLPGAGAAGGCGFGLAIAGAHLVPGARLVCDLVGLDAALRGATVVITGEGRLDRQTSTGKAPAEVATRAASRGRSLHRDRRLRARSAAGVVQRGAVARRLRGRAWIRWATPGHVCAGPRDGRSKTCTLPPAPRARSSCDADPSSASIPGWTPYRRAGGIRGRRSRRIQGDRARAGSRRSAGTRCRVRAARDIGNLDMGHEREKCPQTVERILAGHRRVVLIELQPHAGVIRRLHQIRCRCDRARPVSRDVDIVDGLDRAG